MEHPNTESDGDEPKSAWARIAGSFRQRSRDGTIPLVAGAALVAGALRARTGRGTVGGRILAGTALIGIGIRQRRHRRTVAEPDAVEGPSHSGTGTSEQRADSHHGEENPRGTATEPDIGQAGAPEEQSVQFTQQQEESPSRPDLESGAAGDPRIDEDETTVDLSEASLADEASEATGPSSVQSQPTQTDATEPEETPAEDSKAGDDHSSDTDADDEETDNTSA